MGLWSKNTLPQIQADLAPHGYVAVRVEPTPVMITRVIGELGPTETTYVLIHRAMLKYSQEEDDDDS